MGCSVNVILAVAQRRYRRDLQARQDSHQHLEALGVLLRAVGDDSHRQVKVGQEQEIGNEFCRDLHVERRGQDGNQNAVGDIGQL